MDLNIIHNEDCIEVMKRLPDNCIDLMLTDPPYNITACDWDKPIDFTQLWEQWNRIVKQNGAMIFTASQPFTSELVMSNKKNFKCEWIWCKSHHSNFLLADKQPLKIHESVLIFYRQQPTYNPIMENGEANHGSNGWKKKAKRERRGLGIEIEEYKPNLDGIKFPNSIKFFNSVDKLKQIHPTEKPLNLFRYFIQTYSNEGETVFDGYMGSGTTAEACIIEKRKYIGAEMNKEYFDKAIERTKDAQLQTFLF